MQKKTQEGLYTFLGKTINIIHYDNYLEGKIVGFELPDKLLVKPETNYGYNKASNKWEGFPYTKDEKIEVNGNQYKNHRWYRAWGLPDSKFIKDFKNRIEKRINKVLKKETNPVYLEIYNQLINAKEHVIYDCYYTHYNKFIVREINYTADNFRFDSNGKIYFRTGSYGSSYFREYKLTSINRKFSLNKNNLYYYISEKNVFEQLNKILTIFELKVGKKYFSKIDQNTYIYKEDYCFNKEKSNDRILLIDCSIGFLTSLKEIKED